MASHRRGKRLTHFEVVNRWCLDFYVAEALNAFRDDEYTRFTHIRDHLQSLLEMPIEANSSLPMKLLVMQFLSRIYDGDKLGTKFEESEDSVTPLESAMTVLENICAELEVPQSDLERFHTSLREMVVIVCIKSKEFKKAKEMLQKHFPTRKTPIGKAKLLSDLVQRKCSTHPTLEQLSYSQFRQNTLDFIERVYTMPQPFLSMVARKKNGVVEESQVIKRRSKRLENGTQTVNHTEHTPAPRQEQDTPEHRSSASSGFVTLRVLRKVYETQAKREGLKMPFSRLMEEVYKEAPQEEQEEVQGGEEEQQQEQQEEEEEEKEKEEKEEEEEEIPCKGVTRKETNQNENVQEKTLGGEEAHKESKLGEVTEKEAQEEDNGEETQDEEESVAGSLHLYLSETPLEISEREEVVALWEEEEEEAAMEVEEEEQQQEPEPDREKYTGEAVRPVPPPLCPAPEKATVEQHHRALESDGGKDAGEGDAPVPAVSPPPLSSEESIEEQQQESEPDRDKEEMGKGKEEEEESVLDREKDRSEEDAVVPAVSPPPLSPGHTDHLFSQTDSPSLLAPRRARSRHKNSLLTAPDDGPDSPLHPHSPESESRDPAEQAKSAVNSLPGGLPVSKNRFARYCRVTVAQLVMLPDSQTWTCPSQNSDLKRSAADSTSATEDSLLDDPILPSHTDTEAEKTVGTRPLALALRRLRDPLPNSPVRGSPSTARRSLELDSAEDSLLVEPLLPSDTEAEKTVGTPPLAFTATPNRRSSGAIRSPELVSTPHTDQRRAPLVSTPHTDQRRALRQLKDPLSDSPHRGSPSTGRRSLELASSTPNGGSSGPTRRSRDLGSATPGRDGSNTPGRRKDPLPNTPRRPKPSRVLNDSSDEEPLDSSPGSPPVRKRRKELTMRKMMNATATKEEWSDEEMIFSSTRRSDESKSLANSKKRRWTEEETGWVKEGVQRFGAGKWEKIRSAFPFEGRTSTNIKDRWRTMKNTGIA